MFGQVEVVNHPSPQITASNDTTICAGNTINIYAESDENNYIWNIVPPSYSNNIFVSPVEDTIYNVFTFNDFGCIASADVEITVNESPDIFAEHDINNNLIYVDPAGYNNYEFIIDNEIVQSSSSNEYILPESIRKGDTIFVIVKNIFNCSAEDYVVVETVDKINAFSPNGDGVNDIFMKNSEIIVFNRWGLKLFEGIDGWNGRYHGKLVASGTYYYVHNLKDINGEIIRVIKGSVTVVRQ
ncbi:MAG: gliding motility-associated C-terminal domain-containing protein [Bacteroidales bacterium]|nr:gliding motility-associated C-terminal domain-containing protein [Bacteroidales bacterium]